MPGRVLSVNVGRPEPFDVGKQVVPSAIRKRPVTGRVALRDDRVEGDEQGDPVNHGGRAQAVYAVAIEDLRHFEAALGRRLGPAFLGENLTLEGVDASGAEIGERWRVGTAELLVSAPRVPCSKLGARVGDQRFVRAFARAGRPGAYLAIAREGDVAAGDAVAVLDRPGHGISVALLLEATIVDRSRLPEIEAARSHFLPAVAAYVDAVKEARAPAVTLDPPT